MQHGFSFGVGVATGIAGTVPGVSGRLGGAVPAVAEGEDAGIPLAVADGVVVVAPPPAVGRAGTGDGVGRVVDGVVPEVVTGV